MDALGPGIYRQNYRICASSHPPHVNQPYSSHGDSLWSFHPLRCRSPPGRCSLLAIADHIELNKGWFPALHPRVWLRVHE